MSAQTPESQTPIQLVEKALEVVRQERDARAQLVAQLTQEKERLAKANAAIAESYRQLKAKAMELLKERDSYIAELTTKFEENRARLQAFRQEKETQLAQYEDRIHRLETELAEQRARSRQMESTISRYEQETVRLQQLNESLLDAFKVEGPKGEPPSEEAIAASKRFLLGAVPEVSS